MLDIYKGEYGGFPSSLTAIGDTVYLSARREYPVGIEPFTTDGTARGTRLLKNTHPTYDGGGHGFTKLGRRVYFAANGNLWRTDGTRSGTRVVKDFTSQGGSCCRGLVKMGDHLYFAANDGSSGIELWRSDGTRRGTKQVENIAPGAASSDAGCFFNAGGTLYFRADDGVSGYEVWTSGGTAATTDRVTNIHPQSGDAFEYGTCYEGQNDFASAGGLVYFSAYDGTSWELWTSNGTEGGTKRLTSQGPDSFGAPTELTRLGNVILFSDDYGIYRTNGTASGTSRIGEILYLADDLTNVAGTVFFANDNELWSTDGQAITKVQNIGEGFLNDLVGIGGVLYFSASTDDHGREPWVMTKNGAVSRIGDIAPGPAGSAPEEFTKLGTRILFRADDGERGEELWTFQHVG